MKPKAITILAASLALVSCDKKNEGTNSTDSTTMNQKEQVVALLKSIETGESAPVAVINPEKYIQHNLGIKDGLAGFGEALAALPAGSARVNTVRVLQDGDFVIAHTDYNFFGPKIGFDIFRFEGGKIVEHWDNLQEKPATANPSGHTMIDGSTEVKDLNKTEENKKLVAQFVSDVLQGKAPEKLTSYFDGDNYIQHNPAIADGLSGLGAALEAMAKQGIAMTYDRVHKVLGEGNFGGKAVTFYDLFRVEGGKIAEHWDVVEPVLPAELHQNKNGKFGF